MSERAASTENGATTTLSRAAGEPWDAVVIGAGVAGGVAAWRLARLGRRVLLVERQTMPRPKVCGCCMSGAGVAALRGIGLGGALASGVPLETMRLSSGRAAARIALDRGMVLSRERLDARIVRLALEAGVDFIGETTAVSSRVERGRRAVTLRRGSESREVGCSVVIAATGLGGAVASEELPATVARGSRFGVGTTVEGEGPGAGELWMACGRGGYAGAVRLEDGRVNVAAALDPEATRRAGGPGPMVTAILREARLEVPVLDGARWMGTPALTRTRRVESERLLVVGDAAGYVEPFTGEGMGWAIAGAAAVAGVAERILSGSAAEGEWMALHRRMLSGRQARCAGLSWVLRSGLMTGIAVRSVGRLPMIGRRLAGAVGRPWTETALSGGAA